MALFGPPTDPNYDKEESFSPPTWWARPQLHKLFSLILRLSRLVSHFPPVTDIIEFPVGIRQSRVHSLSPAGCCDDRWPAAAGLAVWVGPSPSLSVNQPFSSSPLKTSDISPLELNWERECRSPAGESGIGIWQEAMRPLTEATGERDRGGDLSKMAQIMATGEAPPELRSVPSFLPPLRSHSDGRMRHSIPVRRPRPRPFSFFLGFLRILPPSPTGPLTPKGGGTSAPSPIVVTSEALTGLTCECEPRRG